MILHPPRFYTLLDNLMSCRFKKWESKKIIFGQFVRENLLWVILFILLYKTILLFIGMINKRKFFSIFFPGCNFKATQSRRIILLLEISKVFLFSFYFIFYWSTYRNVNQIKKVFSIRNIWLWKLFSFYFFTNNSRSNF